MPSTSIPPSTAFLGPRPAVYQQTPPPVQTMLVQQQQSPHQSYSRSPQAHHHSIVRPSLSPQPAPLNTYRGVDSDNASVATPLPQRHHSHYQQGATMASSTTSSSSSSSPSSSSLSQISNPAVTSSSNTMGFAVPSSQVRSSPLLPNNEKKPPNLRVQIPNEEQQQQTQQVQPTTTTTTTTTTNQQMNNRSVVAERAIGNGNKGQGQQASPTTALPSQFAQNLPSPFSIYPEFLQQNELPSPLNFSATPTTSHAFHWPAAASSSCMSATGATAQVAAQQQQQQAIRNNDYRPSPLANSTTSNNNNNNNNTHQPISKRPDASSEVENQRLKKIKLEAV